MAQIPRRELVSKTNKGQFDNLYLLYGDEKLYIKADCDRLITKLMGKQPPEFNYHVFSSAYNLDEIAVAAQVAPFMSGYNTVKLADMDISSLKKDELEKLSAILKDLPDTTVFIIVMPTLEQDLKKPGEGFKKIQNYVAKRGTVCCYTKEDDIALARQVVKWADTRGIKIEQADAYRLIDYVGDDLNTIKNELEKICAYVGDNAVITGEHIELLASRRPEATVYELADAIVAENPDKAYYVLDALFYQKADPEFIIGILSAAYTDFYRVRVSAECGVPMSETAKAFGYKGREFVLKKAAGKTKRISTPALRDSLDAIVSTMADFHSTTLNKRVGLEKLIAQLLVLAGVRG